MVVVVQMVQQMVQQTVVNVQRQVIVDVVQINDIIIIAIIIKDVLQFDKIKDVHLQQQQQQFLFHQRQDVFISMNTKRIYINHAKVRVQIAVIHLQFVLLIKTKKKKKFKNYAK